MTMFLYFPSLKIIRKNIIPNENGTVSFLIYLKSIQNSPKHYPKNDLIYGKIEVASLISTNELIFFKPEQLTIGNKFSGIIDFNPSINKKINLLGLGTEGEAAYFFNDIFNEKQALSLKLKLNYELPPKNIQENKKIKV